MGCNWNLWHHYEGSFPNKHRNFATKITVLIVVFIRKNHGFSIFLCEIQSRCGVEPQRFFLLMGGSSPFCSRYKGHQSEAEVQPVGGIFTKGIARISTRYSASTMARLRNHRRVFFGKAWIFPPFGFHLFPGVEGCAGLSERHAGSSLQSSTMVAVDQVKPS